MRNYRNRSLPRIGYADILSRSALRKRVDRYGFMECATLLVFLELVCDEFPARCELSYIRDKTEACLDAHDNGTPYFADLRALVREIDYVLMYQPWRWEIKT